MGVVVGGIKLNKEKSSFNPEILVSSARKLFEDSGININQQNCWNMGIFLGTTFSNFNARENTYKNYVEKGLRAFNPGEFPKGLISYLGGYLSVKLNLKGMNSTISSAYSSGIDALAQGMYFLRRSKDNKALVIELTERVEKECAYATGESACFIIENGSFSKEINSYREILGAESVFERKGCRDGLDKAVKIALKRSSLDEEKVNCVLDCSCGREDPSSSLFKIGSVLKKEEFRRSSRNKRIIVMFVALGQNSNSSCVILKMF